MKKDDVLKTINELKENKVYGLRYIAPKSPKYAYDYEFFRGQIDMCNEIMRKVDELYD